MNFLDAIASRRNSRIHLHYLPVGRAMPSSTLAVRIVGVVLPFFLGEHLTAELHELREPTLICSIIHRFANLSTLSRAGYSKRSETRTAIREIRSSMYPQCMNVCRAISISIFTLMRKAFGHPRSTYENGRRRWISARHVSAQVYTLFYFLPTGVYTLFYLYLTGVYTHADSFCASHMSSHVGHTSA